MRSIDLSVVMGLSSKKKGRRDKGESGEEGVGGSEEVEGTASLLALLVPMDWVQVVW